MLAYHRGVRPQRFNRPSLTYSFHRACHRVSCGRSPYCDCCTCIAIAARACKKEHSRPPVRLSPADRGLLLYLLAEDGHAVLRLQAAQFERFLPTPGFEVTFEVPVVLDEHLHEWRRVRSEEPLSHGAKAQTTRAAISLFSAASCCRGHYTPRARVPAVYAQRNAFK